MLILYGRVCTNRQSLCAGAEISLLFNLCSLEHMMQEYAVFLFLSALMLYAEEGN